MTPKMQPNLAKTHSCNYSFLKPQPCISRGRATTSGDGLIADDRRRRSTRYITGVTVLQTTVTHVSDVVMSLFLAPRGELPVAVWVFNNRTRDPDFQRLEVYDRDRKAVLF